MLHVEQSEIPLRGEMNSPKANRSAGNKKILILCTGNSCRSQIAEGFLKSFDSNLVVHSAGTNPSNQVHQKAIQVMNEVGIDLSKNYPKKVDQFLGEPFDYLITVCDNAKETCPVFIGKVGKQLHIGFEDPADATGTEEEILSVFRKVRNEIKRDFQQFYEKELR
jgi:arsenate reductase